MLKVTTNYLSDKEWASFLDRQRRYSFFCTPGFYRTWVNFYSPGARILGINVRSNKGEILIPLVEEPWSGRLGIMHLSAAPEWGYGVCGGLPGFSATMLREILADHIGRRVISVRIVTDPLHGVSEMLGFEALPSGDEPGEAYALHLQGSYEDWFKDIIDKRLRRQIRKSREANVRTLRHGVEGLDAFYQLYTKALEQDKVRATVSRYSKPFLEALCRADGPGSTRIYLTYLGDQVIAGRLFAIWQE